jgi:hypothetical protein
VGLILDSLIIVFLGARRQRIENVEALPLEEFLAELPG